MSNNRIQLRRSSVAGKTPLLADLLPAELGFNSADNKLFLSDGTAVHQVNHADYITTTALSRFVSDAQVSAWDAIASATVTGNVRIGSNINVDAAGIISLETADAAHTGVLTAADYAKFDAKEDALGYIPVDTAGDTMTGFLTLSGAPAAANHATTKQYVDDGLALKIDLAGGTFTGSVVLSADPNANLEAATKQYVDNQVGAVSGRYAAPVQTLAALAAVSDYADKQIRLVEDTGALFRFDAQASDAADGVGVILPEGLLAANPGRWIKVQAATQNHNSLTNLQGGAPNDYLHLTTSEKNGYDAHLVNNGLHLTPEQNAWIDALNASAAEVNFLVGVASNVQDQIDSKQATVTGAATTVLDANLNSSIVVVTDANGKLAQSAISTTVLGYLGGLSSNAQLQIDSKVALAGSVMTGFLTLSADPTDALHAASKQYVDGISLDGGTF